MRKVYIPASLGTILPVFLRKLWKKRMMKHAFQRGLLAMALALGVPTSTAKTTGPTTDMRSAQVQSAQGEIFYYAAHDARPPAGSAPWLKADQQDHWIRDYMSYEYRGLERVIHDLDLARIDRDEIEAFQQTLRTERRADDRRLMTAVLAVHETLPPEEFAKGVSSYVGYRPFANDAYLLRHIHDDAHLRELFFDRRRLLEETRRLQTRTNHPRSDDEGRLYNETPELKSLDSLNLVRLNLLLRALQDATVRYTLRDIVADDLANRRTEFGGVMYIDDVHHVRFQQVAGREGNNSSYAGEYYLPLLHALGTFHLHATGGGNDHRYSGPSVPDLRVARMTNTTGVVVTLLGQSRTNYMLGVDFYYVDPRMYNDLPIDRTNPVELSTRTVHVVDMGVFMVRKR